MERGTAYGAHLVRLSTGEVERRHWLDTGRTRRTYRYERVPIESLTFAQIVLTEDYLFYPNSPHSTVLYYGLTYVCDIKRHLVCWPYSLPNLHRMARQLHIERCWFHKTHYDIPVRRTDILLTSALVTSKTVVKVIRGSIGDIAPGVATSWQTLVAS